MKGNIDQGEKVQSFFCCGRKLLKIISLLGGSCGFNKDPHAFPIKILIFPNAEGSHETQRR
jgi:hypothetical protein